MKTVAKIGLFAIAAGLIYMGIDYAKKSLQAFSFSIVRYGSPSLNGGFLQVPITVKFNNTTPVPINLDHLHADVFIQKSGQWVKAGIVDQPLSIPSGGSEQTLIPTVDLLAILGGGASSLFSTITDVLKAKSLAVKTDITVNYAGVNIPTQSFTNDVSIA